MFIDEIPVAVVAVVHELCVAFVFFIFDDTISPAAIFVFAIHMAMLLVVEVLVAVLALATCVFLVGVAVVRVGVRHVLLMESCCSSRVRQRSQLRLLPVVTVDVQSTKNWNQESDLLKTIKNW